MKKKELNALVSGLLELRKAASDDTALAAIGVFPSWKAGQNYTAGERIRHGETLYRVLQNHTSQADWSPENAPSLFAKVLIQDPEVIPDWVQPDSTNPYKKGDKVRHNSAIWTSDIDNNVWEPGVYGWTKT